jgi:hypothetical protein
VTITEQPTFFGRFAYWLTPSVRGWAAGAMVAGLLAFLLIVRVSPASAEGFLVRAQQAERASLRLDASRRMMVRRIAAGGSVSSGIWDPGYLTNEVVASLREVLAANGRSAPLSAAAFARWRESLEERQDEVSEPFRLAGGGMGLRLTTTTPRRAADSQIVSGMLVVRDPDWRAIQETLRVQRGTGVEVYEISEAPVAPPAELSRVEAAPVASVRIARVEETLPAAPVVQLPLPPPGMSPAAGIAIHYALHQIGACLGEQLDVSAENGVWVVSGVVDLPDRLRQIEDALAALPQVSPRVRLAADLAVLPAGSHQPTAVAAESLRSAPAWMDDRLMRHFRATADEKQARTKAREFSDQVIGHAERTWAHAWALRRLAELPPVSSPLVARMVRDHLDQIVASGGNLQAEAGTLFGDGKQLPTVPADHWREQAMQLFRLINDAYGASMSLFARPAGDAPDMLRQEVILRDALSQFSSRIAAIRDALAQEPSLDPKE